MNVGCLLQYQRDAWQDSQAADAVSHLQSYLIDRISRETGMWGVWRLDNAHQRSRMVQFAYHLYPIFFYDKYTLPSPDRSIDLVLKTQNYWGGFGVKPNSSACEDIDSIDILCRLADVVPARHADVRVALAKALQWVLCNQVDDGGFVFRLWEPLTYGHHEMSSVCNQGAMFPTWFRLLSLAYLSRYFGKDYYLINSAPGLKY